MHMLRAVQLPVLAGIGFVIILNQRNCEMKVVSVIVR
jgi:hypothetical protein